MSYYYRQTSTSDFEQQQLDYSKTHYSGYVFLACRWCHVDPCDTEACCWWCCCATKWPTPGCRLVPARLSSLRCTTGVLHIAHSSRSQGAGTAGSLDSESEHSLVFTATLITFCIFIDLPHGLSRWMMECALKSFAWHLLSLEPFPSAYNSVRHFTGRRRTLVKTTHYHSNTNKVVG